MGVASLVVGKKDRKGVKYPLYLWNTQETKLVSKKQAYVVECWIETMSLRECVEMVKEEFKRKVSPQTIQSWLEQPWVKEYTRQRVEEKGLLAGWTEGRWMKRMNDHLEANKDLEQAQEDLRSYSEILKLSPEDMEAKIGLINARKALLQARIRRLASGDLKAMQLIGMALGIGGEKGGVQVTTQIAFTQANGKA